jgi:MoaA/NifB/PqqE/SkfB family radical SAM enzyme
MRRAWLAFRRAMRRRRRLREIRAGKSVLQSLPATVNIEFSGRCNVWPPCTYCVGKHAPGYQEPPPITKEQLGPYWKYLLQADRVNDTTYGEPLMYPEIHELIDRMGRAGVKFGFTSNGLLLTEKKARLLARHGDRVDICISVNAASKEIYYLHQGKDFDKLITNIERFVAIHRQVRPGRPVPLALSFIVMRSNRHEVIDFIRLGRRLGVRTVLFRHLFDLGEDRFEANVFGQHFVYGRERLPFEDYKEIEREIRATEEFKVGNPGVLFAWNGDDSFIKQQAEPGVDIPCLFPWKFLCIRPLHGYYTPCVYIKKGIAKTNQTVDQVWNGEVMQELRQSLAKKEVPRYCCEHSDICPLVLEKRARESAAATPEAPEAPAVRTVRLPVLAVR